MIYMYALASMGGSVLVEGGGGLRPGSVPQVRHIIWL